MKVDRYQYDIDDTDNDEILEITITQNAAIELFKNILADFPEEVEYHFMRYKGYDCK